MPESYIYDRTPESLEKVYQLQGTKTKILCPVCYAELIIALDLDSARRYHVHTGIYCPVDHSHVEILVELASVHRDFWQWMGDRAKEREDK